MKAIRRVEAHALLLLPACHQGVYARLRRAMEKVGMRGSLHKLRLAESPHPPPPRQACEPLPVQGGCDTEATGEMSSTEKRYAGQDEKNRLDRNGPHGLSDGRAAAQGRLRRFDLEPHARGRRTDCPIRRRD